MLKHKGPHATSPISRFKHDRFGISANECGPVVNAARLYCDGIWLVDKLSRDAVIELSARATPDAVREVVERLLRAGEKVGAPEIKRLRKTLLQH